MVGGGLVLAGLAIGVGLFVWTLRGFLDTEATVPADGRPHAVSVGTDGDRMLWGHDGVPNRADCLVRDRATGRNVVPSPVGGSFSRSDSSGTWVGLLRFDAGSGRLEVTCTRSAGEEFQIGAAPDFAAFVGGILATVLVPLVLGGIGLVVLIVTGVLFATGGPRKPQPAPSYPPTGRQPR
ncbi:hypothetical protein GCM10027601_14060 [Nocardioides ungokensis]